MTLLQILLNEDIMIEVHLKDILWASLGNPSITIECDHIPAKFAIFKLHISYNSNKKSK